MLSTTTFRLYNSGALRNQRSPGQAEACQKHFKLGPISSISASVRGSDYCYNQRLKSGTLFPSDCCGVTTTMMAHGRSGVGGQQKALAPHSPVLTTAGLPVDEPVHLMSMGIVMATSQSPNYVRVTD